MKIELLTGAMKFTEKILIMGRENLFNLLFYFTSRIADSLFENIFSINL